MNEQLFTWTPERYAILAGLVIPLLAAIGGSIYWARRNPKLQGYPVIASITILMFPFVALFLGMHLLWPEGFKELPEFIHIFYDRTLHMQRDNLASFVAHVAMGMTIWFFWLVQFHPKARVKYPKLHNWTGRLYFLLMVPFIGTSLHIMFHTPAPPMTWKSLITIQCFLTVLTSVLALRSILQGKVFEHHKWMLRNVAVMAQTFFMRIYLLTLTVFTQDIGDILTASHALGFITSMAFFAWYFEPKYLSYLQRSMNREKEAVPRVS